MADNFVLKNQGGVGPVTLATEQQADGSHRQAITGPEFGVMRKLLEDLLLAQQRQVELLELLLQKL